MKKFKFTVEETKKFPVKIADTWEGAIDNNFESLEEWAKSFEATGPDPGSEQQPDKSGMFPVGKHFFNGFFKRFDMLFKEAASDMSKLEELKEHIKFVKELITEKEIKGFEDQVRLYMRKTIEHATDTDALIYRLINDEIDKFIGQPSEPIIDKLNLELIYREYGHLFKGETSDSWIARFVPGNKKLKPIDVEPAARQGTARLALIAILAAVHDKAKTLTDFRSFVLLNFGIPDFYVKKKSSKEQNGFDEIYNKCTTILKN
jgi:hypothetical protein